MKHEAFKQAEIVDKAYAPNDENYARLSQLNNNEPSTIASKSAYTRVEGVLAPGEDDLKWLGENFTPKKVTHYTNRSK